jgi:hypothetical protein
MRTRANKATKNWERIKFERNISAVEAYKRIYGNRKFRILPNRRLQYQIGGIVVTARADLWAEEEGIQVQIKIDRFCSLRREWRGNTLEASHGRR